MEKKSNRLINEKSPYLLQHAYNPVDWFPWSEMAFNRAREENKPIFLSIGYSTCHWCHVMERESFEDEEIAKMMNEIFISIKVDREERPDIDSIYMKVCQLMTGGGGWPLTIIMTPDKEPFFAGTYFANASRFGKIGMRELIPWVDGIWKKQKGEVETIITQIKSALEKMAITQATDKLDARALQKAFIELEKTFDEKNGGFGKAPKFPMSHNLLFLLRYHQKNQESDALKIVDKTLQKMRNGGIYDHIGFGFHRYSTDSRWFLPHFEKMLYDQAMLTMAFTEAYLVTSKEEYKKTAKEILTYVLRDMTSPEGGLYSAEDADSEGVEGRFYIWTTMEIYERLDKYDADLIINVFNFKDEGNFFEEASQERTGDNILHIDKPLKEYSVALSIPESELRKRIASALSKLLEIREKRVHPFKDDKILTDWNGLMIAAFAKAARAFNEPKYRDAAKKAADFILHKMQTKDGRLLHRYRDGEAIQTAFLDDYAFFIFGLIELYEATFDVKYLENAIRLNGDLIEHFWDKQDSGFFLTPDDGEKLLFRDKEAYDGAIPSGNALAMMNLLKLLRVTGEAELEKKAEKIGITFSETIARSPSAHAMLLSALDFALGSSFEVVIVGKPDADDTKALIKSINSKFIPNKVVLFKPTDDNSPKITELAPFTKDHVCIDGKATVYICKNYVCELPTTDEEEMMGMLVY